jgi:hypothetical protein
MPTELIESHQSDRKMAAQWFTSGLTGLYNLKHHGTLAMGGLPTPWLAPRYLQHGKTATQLVANRNALPTVARGEVSTALGV